MGVLVGGGVLMDSMVPSESIDSESDDIDLFSQRLVTDKIH